MNKSSIFLTVLLIAITVLFGTRCYNSLAEYFNQPLRAAIIKGDLESLQHLLNSESGSSEAYNYALRFGLWDTSIEKSKKIEMQHQIFELLIANNVPFDYEDDMGNSLLHLLCSGGYINASPYEYMGLIEEVIKEVDVNRQNIYGETALHELAIHINNQKDLAVLQCLSDNGGDFSIKNKNHKTPLEVAEDNDNFLFTQFVGNQESS